MAYTAGCCSMKAQFIPLGIAFGSIRKRLELFRFYSVWKRWDILEGDLKETSKDWNNTAIKGRKRDSKTIDRGEIPRPTN